MRRREFITLLGGAAAWPLAAQAQQAAMPVVGFLFPGSPELSTGIVAAFRKGLREIGFAEGRNVAIEFRFGYNDNARLPELAADLVHRRVAVIATPGSTPAETTRVSERTPYCLAPSAGWMVGHDDPTAGIRESCVKRPVRLISYLSSVTPHRQTGAARAVYFSEGLVVGALQVAGSRHEWAGMFWDHRRSAGTVGLALGNGGNVRAGWPAMLRGHCELDVVGVRCQKGRAGRLGVGTA
jgi:hypothetical protein